MPASESELWNSWVEPFDLFVSYSRKDNADGMVTALVEEIERDHARFSPSSPLRVFFDKKDIVDGEHWLNKLRRALRQSKVMVAILSPSYFASEYCRWEWEEYLSVEQARTYPGESITPIFIVDPQRVADGLSPGVREWWDNLNERHGIVELHTTWSEGRARLQEQEIAERLERLKQNVHDRAERGRLLSRVPRNLFDRNPNFTGRRAELAALRNTLVQFEIPGLCAIHGVGGIGKSTLAREYAYLFRPEYLGGQFEINLANIHDPRDLQSQLVRLARDYFHVPISEELSEQEQFERAVDAFNSRPPGQQVLLILDNLDEQDGHLLDSATRKQTLPSPERVHVIVTTRLGPKRLKGIPVVTVDTLSPADALDVLFRYRQYAVQRDDPEYLEARAGNWSPPDGTEVPPDAEWKAALSIANRLGRHTLAVALVGAYLGIHREELGYIDFLQDMTELGLTVTLDAVGGDDAVSGLLDHPETVVGKLFDRTVDRLAPLSVAILEYASLLSADFVPVGWIESLIRGDGRFPNAFTRQPLKGTPFVQALAELQDLQYLGGGPPMRMHRILQDVVRERQGEADRDRRELAVRALIQARACELDDRGYLLADDQPEFLALDATLRDRWAQPLIELAIAARALVKPTLDRGNVRRAGELADWAHSTLLDHAGRNPDPQVRRELAKSHESRGDVAVSLGNLQSAVECFETALALRRELSAANPAEAEIRRELAVSFRKMGSVHVRQGQLATGRQFFEESLAIARALHESDPGQSKIRRDLVALCDKLGSVSVREGSLAAARESFEKGLDLVRPLIEADPRNVQAQRDFAGLLEKVGSVALKQGFLPESLRLYEEGLAIARRLAEADPHNTQAQRDVSLLLEKLAGVTQRQGDLAASLRFLEESLAVSRRLAEADPHSAQAQRDVSMSCEKLGAISAQQGMLPTARQFFEECLATRRRLAQSDVRNANARRDLSVACEKLGNVCVQQGNLQEARQYFEEMLALRRELAETDASNAEARRDLSSAFEKLGNLTVQQGDLRTARQFFSDGLLIRRELSESDPLNAQARRHLSTACNFLGNVAVQLGDLSAARGSYEESLALRRQLAANDERDAQAQRDLSISYEKLGEVSVRQGDLRSARDFFQDGLATRRRLAESDPLNAQARRDVSISLERLADLCIRQSDLDSARTFLEDCRAIRLQLSEADPTSAQLQRDVSIAYEKLGDVSLRLGNSRVAREHFQAGLTIRRRLAEADPLNSQAHRDLCSLLDRLGNVSLKERKVRAARAFFEEGLAITRRLSEADPLSAQAKRDLSISQIKLGDVSLLQKDLHSARRFFEECLAVRRELASVDPANAQAQRDLSTAFSKLGDLLARDGDVAAGLELVGQAHSLRLRLSAAEPSHVQAQRDLVISHSRLARLFTQAGLQTEAQTHWQSALRLLDTLALGTQLDNSLTHLHKELRDQLKPDHPAG